MIRAIEREAMSVEEAAEAANIGRTMFYEPISSGNGPATIKLGRRRVVRRAALAEWLKRLEAEQDAEASRGRV